MTAWIVPLLLLGSYLVSAFVSRGKPWTWLLVSALVAYAVLYIRFIRWPCPRCGNQSTRPSSHGIFCSKRCTFCGLPAHFGNSGS